MVKIVAYEDNELTLQVTVKLKGSLMVSHRRLVW